MRSVCVTFVSLLLAVGAVACFSETPLDDGPSESSESSGCPAGALGCECYGNATCDPMLECASGTCVPAGCELGHVDCLCDNESCVEPLICVNDICAAPSDSSGSESESATTMPADTSSGPSTTAETSESGETSSTSYDPDSTGSSSTTGEPIACDELACGDCVTCVLDPGQPCAAAGDTCAGLMGCNEAAECMRTCGVKGLCLDNCCASTTPAAADAAMLVNQCRADACSTPCGDYPDAICNPP